MSFFIKGKRKNTTNSKAQINGIKKKIKDDELTSESDSGSENETYRDGSEDEDETAQEKRLRLAKIYLQEIEKEEKERLKDSEIDSDVVSARLKEDYLKQTGKLKTTVADQYTSVDTNGLSVLRCKEHKIAVTCLCISSDNKYIFSGSKDGGLVKWLILERKKVKGLPFKKRNVENDSNIEGHSLPIICIAISDDFKFLAVGDESKDIQIWNPENLTHLHTFKGHKDSVTGLAFRTNSQNLYSCSKDKSVKVWSLAEMSYLETLFGHQDPIMAIDALIRERAITAGGNDSTLRIWKIAEESQLVYNGTGSIDCVKLINEENFISGGDSGELNIWSTMKKKPICILKNAHDKSSSYEPAWICSIASLVNTDLLASGSSDGYIRLWKVSNSFRTLSPLFTIPVEGFINSLSFTNDGKFLIAAVGQEHKYGRWTTIKQAKNGILIIPLIKNS